MTVLHYGWITLFVLAQCVVTGLAKEEDHCFPNVSISSQLHTVCYRFFKYQMTDTAVTELKKMEEVCTNATIVADGVSRRMYPLHFDVQAEVDILGEMIEERVNTTATMPQRCSSHFPVVRRGNSLPDETKFQKIANYCITYDVKKKDFNQQKCRDAADLNNTFVYVICKAKFVPTSLSVSVPTSLSKSTAVPSVPGELLEEALSNNTVILAVLIAQACCVVTWYGVVFYFLLFRNTSGDTAAPIPYGAPPMPLNAPDLGQQQMAMDPQNPGQMRSPGQYPDEVPPPDQNPPVENPAPPSPTPGPGLPSQRPPHPAG